MKKIIFFIICLFCFNLHTNAASASLSVSRSTIEEGEKVTATVSLSSAAAWNITITSSGATSGCTQSFVGDSGTGQNTSKSFSVTCRSTGTGTINFVLSGDITNEDIKTTKVSDSRKVTVVTPREKSDNNKLKSLSVDGYDISPAFSKDVNEYTVTVPSTVEKITIEAKKADSYADLEGIGEKTVEEGVNTFEIIVTSETGISNVYKLIVNVEDINPLKVNVNNRNYTVVKVAKNLTKPNLFEETTIKIGEYDIPAFISEITKIKLVGLKDENGKIDLFIYNDGKYEEYKDHISPLLNIVIKEPKEIPQNFEKKKMTINEDEINVYTNGTYILIYGINLENGKENFYSYESTEKTLQIFDINIFETEKEEQNNNKYLVYGLSIGILLLLLLVMLLSSKCSKLSKLVKLNEKIKIINEEKASLLEKNNKDNILVEEEKKNKKKNKK